MKLAESRVCGVDEAGRGPLAGAVFAACVILDPDRPIAGLADSKVLSAGRREALALQIQSRASAWSVALASVAEVDSLNILAKTAQEEGIIPPSEPQPQGDVDGSDDDDEL